MSENHGIIDCHPVDIPLWLYGLEYQLQIGVNYMDIMEQQLHIQLAFKQVFSTEFMSRPPRLVSACAD